MGFLAMAGYNTNQILSATPQMMNLAAAGSIELGEAADIASNILGGMGLKIEDTAMVTDVLAKAASGGNTNIQMMGEAFKYVAPQLCRRAPAFKTWAAPWPCWATPAFRQASQVLASGLCC